MSDKRKQPPPKPPTPEKPATLARTPVRTLVARTEAEWRRFLDTLVDEANRGLRRSGLEHDAVADLLFRSLFDSDVEAALAPEANPTEAFRRVAERAGASLRLLPAGLVTHVRIGAMNQHRRDAAWTEMDWSRKELLVGLLGVENGKALLKEGILMAGRPNVGVEHVRAFVFAHVPKKPGSPGRPRSDGLTLSGGGKLAKAGVQLRSERARRAFVKKVQDAPPEKRKALVKDLRDALAGLQALVEDLDVLDET